MSIVLRVVLILASILNCAGIIRRICKSQAKIEDAVFWVSFSGVLIALSLFPQLANIGAFITGVQSPVNFIFLCIIFILLVKIFRLSIKLSILESKLQAFAQRYGIDHMRNSVQDRKEQD